MSQSLELSDGPSVPIAGWPSDLRLLLPNPMYATAVALNTEERDTRFPTFRSYCDGERLFDPVELLSISQQIALNTSQMHIQGLHPDREITGIVTRLTSESDGFSLPTTFSFHPGPSTTWLFDAVLGIHINSGLHISNFANTMDLTFAQMIYYFCTLSYTDFQLSIDARGTPFEPKTYFVNATYKPIPKNY